MERDCTDASLKPNAYPSAMHWFFQSPTQRSKTCPQKPGEVGVKFPSISQVRKETTSLRFPGLLVVFFHTHKRMCVIFDGYEVVLAK